MNTILVVDDDDRVHRLVRKGLTEPFYRVHSTKSIAEGLQVLHERSPEVLLVDIDLSHAAEVRFRDQVQAIDPHLPVVYISGSGASDSAIQAMKLGAFDFLLKPLDKEQIQSVVERALETRRRDGLEFALGDSTGDAENTQLLMGRSPAMLEVYKEIGRVAEGAVTVLIYGESGTGKELVARAIYQHSQRADKPFLAVNCAALSESLLESELFGHEKGAFTGADRRRIGKFEQCNGGTIFLDEIGDMSPAVQSKVLRLVQEQTYERVGGTETIGTDVRIIAATNRDLAKMVQEGAFRLDLFHRLNDYCINLPPLRERGDDIVLLCEHFLTHFGKSLGKQVQGIATDTMRMLQEYPWPGNVRELQTSLKKTVLKANGSILIPDFLPETIRGVRETPVAVGGEESSAPPHDLKIFVDEQEQKGTEGLYATTAAMMERYLLTRILRETQGNQSKTAAVLGITRGSLRFKLRSLGIVVDHSVHVE